MVQQEVMVESMSAPNGWDDEPFSEVEALSRQDLDSWRDDANGMRQWMKTKEGTLGDESDDEDIVGLKQERKQLTVCGYYLLIIIICTECIVYHLTS